MKNNNNNIQPTNKDLLEAINNIDKRVNGIEVNNFSILEAISQFSTEVDMRFDSVESRLGNLETGQEGIIGRVTNLETGQEEIKLRLNNKANTLDLEALERRVDLLASN